MDRPGGTTGRAAGTANDLSVIQRCYDLLAWFIPRLERLPRSHKYTLGERIQHTLYDLLEELIFARYSRGEVDALARANARLEVLRCQVRLLVQFDLLDQRRYEHVSGLINAVGVELGAWTRYRRRRGGREADREPVAGDRLLGEPAAGLPPRAEGEAV